MDDRNVTELGFALPWKYRPMTTAVGPPPTEIQRQPKDFVITWFITPAPQSAPK